MEDGECFCIASPPDMSVTSSTSCTDDQSVKTVDMTENLHSSDENAEVSSSCEMQPSSFPTEVDLLNNQAVDTIEDIDTLQATLSPVDDLCLAELTSSSVAELLLNDLSPTDTNYALSGSHSFSGTSVSAKHPLTKPLTDEMLMPTYSGLPLPPDVDGLLSNTPLAFQDDLQSLLPVSKLSSDVMLSDNRHSLVLPEAAAVDLDALDTFQLVGTQPLPPACELDAYDFVLDDADWSSVQDWSALLEQGCLDQFGGNTESDDHVLLSGSTVIADFIDIPQKEDDMSSKKQLRRSLRIQDNELRDLAEKIRQANQLKEREDSELPVGKMMSCGVALERLHIDESNMVLSATECKDKSSDVWELNTTDETYDKNKALNLQAKCSSMDKDIRKTGEKLGEKVDRDVCGLDCTNTGCSCNATTSTANLRLTLKKVKLENSDREEDTCIYVCRHSKKSNMSKKLLVKCADRSSYNINKMTSRSTKHDHALTDSGKSRRNDRCQTDRQTSIKCLRTCRGLDCNKVTNPLVSLFCSDHCIDQYVKLCTEMQTTAVTRDKNDAHLVMLEHATGKLVTGCHAPTLSSLCSWIKRHPTFEVVQSMPSANQSKKSESVKNPLPSMKKKASRVTAVIEQSVTMAHNSKKETVGSNLIEKKVGNKTSQSGEVDEERKCKHHGGTKNLNCRKSQKSKGVVKSTVSKHKIVDVNPQQVQQDIQTEKLYHCGDLLPEHSVCDSPGSVKKLKLRDAGRKLHETCVQTKQHGDNLVEYQKKGNTGGLRHFSNMEQADDNNKLQLQERHQRADEKVGKKSNVCVKAETGDTEVTADGGVDKYYDAGKNEHRRNSARHHVCRGLYRALSSRTNELNDALAVSDRSLKRLASNIENELHSYYGGVNSLYKRKYHALVASLKDTRSMTLLRRVVYLQLMPSELVRIKCRLLTSEHGSDQSKQHDSIENDKSGAVTSVVNMSLVNVDSTKQHGAHVFDVNCRICTVSDDKTCPPSSTVLQSNMPICHVPSLPKDTDSSLDVGRSSHSFRKKICLTQRLKMYSAELQKNSISNSDVQVDNKCVSDAAEVTVQQNDGVPKLMHSFEEALLNKSKLKADSIQWQMQTVEKLQKGMSVECKNADKQKFEECFAEVLDEPQKDSVTSSLHSGVAKQQVDHSSWKCLSLQEVCSKKNHIAARATMDSDVIWRGNITSPDVTTFSASVHRISGSMKYLKQDLPHELLVMGRIPPATVIDYLQKIKQAPVVTREIAVVYFRASTENEDGFSQLFIYLQERQRCAVLGSIGASIKDMYIWPLPDNSSLPSVLLPFDGPGLPECHKNMLVGIVVQRFTSKENSRMEPPVLDHEPNRVPVTEIPQKDAPPVLLKPCETEENTSGTSVSEGKTAWKQSCVLSCATEQRVKSLPLQSYRGEKVIDEPYEPYDDDDDQSVETGSSTTPTPVNWDRLETKFSANSEELIKLVESARSGGLQPDRLSDVLSAASLSVGHDCRSQLLMQLILLIQQQLTAASTNTAVRNQDHSENNSDPSATIKALQDDNETSLSTSVADKALTLNAASRLIIETRSTNKENEMDKLLAWKNRIENASLTSNEQLNSTDDEQNEVRRCSIPDPASPDTSVQSFSETSANGKSSSVSSDNVAETDVVQSVSCCRVSPQLRTPLLLSPASPPAGEPAQYPPLPTPPKPPANLLMNVDSSNRRDELYAQVLPFPPTPDSAVCCSSATAYLSNTCKSADTACRPCVSLPSSLNATLSTNMYSMSVVTRSDCAWPNVSAVSGGHGGSHCLETSASLVPFKSLCHDTSSKITHSSSMERLLTENCASEVWHSNLSTNTSSRLKSLQEVHGPPDIVRTPSQDLCIPHRRTARLKSPSTWMSRLASPSVFMLQSSASRLQSAANIHQEAMFSSHKSADLSSATETSHCGQRMLPEQQHLPCPVDSRHFTEHSDLFCVSHCEVAGQLNLTVNHKRLRDSDDVSTDSKGCLPKSEEESDTECKSVVASQLTTCDSQCDDDTVRISTDKVLMKLAGMPVGSDVSGNCDIVAVSEAEATRCDHSTVLTASSTSSAQHDGRSSQIADSSTTFVSDCGPEKLDETSKVSALVPTADQVTCETANAIMSCDELRVSVQSSQQATSDMHATQQQQQQEVVNDDDLEEGEIVDDCCPTPTVNQRELPQATKQLLFFLKTDPVRKSSSSQWLQPRTTAAETPRRHRDDRYEDFDKYRRTNSTSRRRW